MPEDVFGAIRGVFGRYKAEWLRGDVFHLFRRPGYFPELEEPRPTALVGGRGTGKTSVLKSLSYVGHYELNGRDQSAPVNAPYAGLYWCIDTNRVSAFSGPELTAEQWLRVFGHYVNLEVVAQFCDYVLWYERITGFEVVLPRKHLKRVGASLHAQDVQDVHSLAERVAEELVRLESSVNTIADAGPVSLSLQGTPIEYIAEGLSAIPAFANRVFYIIIDEFENLDRRQQSLLNTLIKHGRGRVIYKIGVKESGWRTKETMSGEPLIHPGDYDLIDLSERFGDGQYARFAREVCDARLSHAFQRAGLADLPTEMPQYFETLSVDDEARLLGVEERVRAPRREALADAKFAPLVSEMPDLDLYYLARKAESDGVPLRSVLADLTRSPDTYLRSYRQNYRQALLYTIRKHSGRGLQKYYAGWSTLSKVSGGNIRYLVEIVERAFEIHSESRNDISVPVSPKDQTDACIAIGRKYTQEVQALDPQGQRLTFLLLGLGRFFGLLARHSMGRQPDTTSFVITTPSDPAIASELQGLLRTAVMHQILRRWPATKLTSANEAKEPEYSVHPVFSAFFVFPYQKKRRIRLKGDDIVLLASNVKDGLSALLSAADLEDDITDAPDQLSLFEAAYG